MSLCMSNSWRVPIRNYVALSKLVIDEGAGREFERWAMSLHRQLWTVKQMYEAPCGRELCLRFS